MTTAGRGEAALAADADLLYEDLYIQEDTNLFKTKEELKTLRGELKGAQVTLAKLQKENKAYARVAANLKKNISCLYATAKSEIDRKNALLADKDKQLLRLRREVQRLNGEKSTAACPSSSSLSNRTEPRGESPRTPSDAGRDKQRNTMPGLHKPDSLGAPSQLLDPHKRRHSGSAARAQPHRDTQGQTQGGSERKRPHLIHTHSQNSSNPCSNSSSNSRSSSSWRGSSTSTSSARNVQPHQPTHD